MTDYPILPYAQRLDWFKRRIDTSQNILEIGPSHSPIAPRKAGYRTTIIDACTTEELRRKYRAMDVDTRRIESVDYVWRGQSLTELLKGKEPFDAIVASHVIEHIPDLLGFFDDCRALLKDEGRLLLAVPDQRRCFDLLRVPSTPGQILEAHFAGRKSHALAAVYDFHAAFCTANDLPSWFSDTFEPSKLALANTPQAAYRAFRQALEYPDRYFDVHGWTFTPASFLLIVKELEALDSMRLTLCEFAGSDGHEFYAAFSRAGDAANWLAGYERLELYRAVSREWGEALAK